MSTQSAIRTMGLLERLFAARSVASGALLYMGMRWFDRALGVVSTIILARLLVPDDFGVVALASIVFGFLAVMFDVGLNVRLVQMGEIDRTDVDTAWTLQLLRNLLLAALLFSAAPTISDYFNDLRLTAVMRWMALGILVSGVDSMAPVLFQKRREYAREVSYFMSKRVVGFATTIALAFWLKNYWAMVYGSFVATVFACVLSYWMMPELRRPTLQRWRRFLGATAWLTLRSLGTYGAGQLDKLFLGRVAGSATLGAYSLASQVGAMPSTEVLAPMNRALFPAYVQAREDPVRLGNAVHLTLGVQTMIALPASIGLALCSGEVVRVFLGEKWLEAAPLLAILSLAYGFASLKSSFFYLLLSLGKFRLQAMMAWTNCIALAAILLTFSSTLDANSVAAVRMGLAWFSTVFLFFAALSVRGGVTARGCWRNVWRPIVSTLVMAGAVLGVGEVFGPDQAVWKLLVVKVFVGAMTYPVVLFVLWRSIGSPEGAERWALSAIQKSRRGGAA